MATRERVDVDDVTMLSVVVPIKDEEGSLSELHRRLAAALDPLVEEWELILVDDGSVDRSFQTMLELRGSDPRVKLVRLSRNFGHQVAITAGLDLAEGAAVVVMDGDLQHPPEVIPQFIDRWREGYEVIYGVMTAREGETWLKKRTAALFYRLLRRLTDIEMPLDAGDFRLIDRKAVDAFASLRERNRYVRGMFSWVGFRQIGVRYTSPRRFAGQTKYTRAKMFRLARDGIFSFSNIPLRIVLRGGFFVSGLAILETIFAIVNKLGGYHVVPGWASIVILVSFVSGVQLIVLGVVGEYIGLIYDEVKQRPIYLVGELHGFERQP